LARLCATTAPHPHALFQELDNYATKTIAMNAQRREKDLPPLCFLESICVT
jgi:hypothetical protein